MSQPELLYIYDPLCGWCYGFSAVMKKIREHYGSRLSCKVFSGGMAIGVRAQAIGTGWSFIGRSLHVVEETAGVQFGEKFRALVQEGKYIYNSEPPCIAMTVFKEYQPERAVDFAHDMQRALFYNGLSLNEPETYSVLVEPYGIDAVEFVPKIGEERYRMATYQEFQTVSAMGVQGFPTLVYVDGERGMALARGYQPYEPIAAKLDVLLGTAKQL